MTKDNGNDNGNEPTQETNPANSEGFTINPIKDLVWALTELDLLYKRTELNDPNLALYQGMIERTIEAYYSFLDTQALLDSLANSKATAMLQLFNSVADSEGNMGVIFVSDFTPVTEPPLSTDAATILKGPWTGSTTIPIKKDNDDDSDDDGGTKH